MIINNVEIHLTPKQLAEELWRMSDLEQAQMFGHLYDLTNGEHMLMLQFLWTRQCCEEMKQNGDSRALDAFQAMFSAGYKYMGV